MKSFQELYPDYPIKRPSKAAKIRGYLSIIGVVAAIGGVTTYVLYHLSTAQIPMPAMAGLPQPTTEATEQDLLESLTVEQLQLIGRQCFDNDDSSCVKTIFNRVLQLQPNDLNALASLGLTEFKLGERDRANEHLKKYLELGGEKSRVAKFLNK